MKDCLLGTIFAIATLAFTACSDDNALESNNDSNKSSISVTIKELLIDVLTEWEISRDDIESSMIGYDLVYTDENMMQYRVPNTNQCISYYIKDDKLNASSIIIPNTADLDLQSLFERYTYIGTLDMAHVYENRSQNTMIFIWQPFDINKDFFAIGFAPIKSDAFGTVSPITITTNDEVEANACSAILSGNISGVDKAVKVGFIYGRNNNLTEYNGKQISTTSNGSFKLKIEGLIDDETYYYRAFAVVDDVYYFSKINTFKTNVLTYTVGNSTYKMIKVEGGGLKPFSIMQTELPSDKIIIINNFYIGVLNKNNDRGVTKAEFRSFLEKIRETTGINFRLPTIEEWKYAASGGSKSKGYTYSGSNNINSVAWYNNNSNYSPHQVALKSPNELELFDMSGNYSELCYDYIKGDEFSVDGPFCGGCWNDMSYDCTVTSWEYGSVIGNIPDSKLEEKWAFDAKYITIRLVYSRDIQ